MITTTQRPGTDTADIESRLVIAEENTLSITLTNKQNFYRVLDLLEDRGRDFFVVER